MKLLLFFLLTLSGLSLPSARLLAQNTSIPSGADGIELTTTLADSVLFEAMLSFLENEGFTIQEADDASGRIITDYKIAPGLTAIRVLVSVGNSVAIVTGEAFYESEGTEFRDEPLVYEGEPDDPTRTGFGQLSELSRRFAQTQQQVTLEYVLP